ncbi:hypothetical protein V3481_012885 [Fusarium oxysporum f. sp. vasinfectum]|uniref:BTB domain-containing protein n=1 Tax=Fusarium oxysporum f. sp. vasinfectum 25433 TaxID=1089449 RepID=X0KJQ5_FUSOX|nr:hypothetical protein FOTG_17717 [Fusarium oxysporum f. sp. vasinfectum 25433]
MAPSVSNAELATLQGSLQKIPSSKRPSTYIFDSHGDTTLTLNTYKSQPFNWEAETIWVGHQRPSKKKLKKKKREKGGKQKSLASLPPPPASALPESPVPISLSVRQAFDSFSSITYSRPEFSDDETTEPGSAGVGKNVDSPSLQIQDWDYGERSGALPDQVEIRMLVSGQHLALASSYFGKMFAGPFTEAEKDHSGLRQVQASDWDPEAFNIILTIIHGYHRDVPKLVNLELLAKLAIIVDYYECHESIELYVDIWLENLKSEIPTVYGRDCILYMLISWVFTRSDIFQKMIRLASRHSGKLIECEGLPLPTEILEEIDQARQDSLDDMFSAIYDLLDRLLEETECSYECSSMSLGVLTKELSKRGILSPRIAQPFCGWSVNGAQNMIKGLRRPEWYDHRYGPTHSCTIQQKLSPVLDEVETSCMFSSCRISGL